MPQSARTNSTFLESVIGFIKMLWFKRTPSRTRILSLREHRTRRCSRT
jgi:hypothetical protein